MFDDDDDDDYDGYELLLCFTFGFSSSLVFSPSYSITGFRQGAVMGLGGEWEFHRTRALFRSSATNGDFSCSSSAVLCFFNVQIPLLIWT